MNILTTGDWHLGNTFHGNDRLAEHRHFLQWLLDLIDERKPDALLIAGDVFDNGNPSAAAQSAYYGFLASVTAARPSLQVVIIAGNHDSAHRLEAPRPLLSHHRVEVRGNVRRSWRPDPGLPDGGAWVTDLDDLIIPLSGADGSGAVVLAVPYLRGDSLSEESYSDGVGALLRRLTDRARELHPDKPLVMMAHMYATGAEIADNSSERIVVGGQEQVDLHSWKTHPDYMFSGHIHKRQHIRNTDWARYTGSVLPMSFAELDYRHGVDLLTVSHGVRPQVEFIEYRPQHPLLSLPARGEADLKAMLRLIGSELPDRVGDAPDAHAAYLELRLTCPKPDPELHEKIDKALSRKNAILCRLVSAIPVSEETAVDNSPAYESIDDVAARDPFYCVSDCFKAQHGTELTETQVAIVRRIVDQALTEEK